MGRSRNRTVSPYEPRRRARRRALQALYQWQLNDDSAASIIKQFLEEQNFDDVDAEYFQGLVRDVIAEGPALDRKLGPHVERIDSSLDQMERVILRIGAVELLKHPEIPYRVVIDEAVELAHRFGAEQGHLFVNGVLDRLARELRPVEFQAESGG
ncbi:MAG: transcription antitermination factor NusB [Wenzhouxiangellaceae bacterium]|nr:transcription antitermination factor NusB [Wenzhouxiangellaceae bacterium]MBS3745674.1 transcription antitermination factor NusB [Wenzhouxiangellaceae bacterium]MBS3822426.1 transcription antitermination factor NusB [Wenzhouxiangellaceae bacterium]